MTVIIQLKTSVIAFTDCQHEKGLARLMLFLMLFDLLRVNDVDGWALTDQMIAALFVDYMHSHHPLF